MKKVEYKKEKEELNNDLKYKELELEKIKEINKLKEEIQKI